MLSQICAFVFESHAAFFYSLVFDKESSMLNFMHLKYFSTTIFLTFCTTYSIADEVTSEKNIDDSIKLNDVVVTGSKIPKKAVELTHSVTVVNEHEIETQAFTDVTEILRKEVGLEFTQVGGPGQFNFLKLRGLSARNVLLVIDGVKINKPSSGDIGNLLSQIDPKTIESIEILRGPQATLYGANNSAGVISIKTKSGHSGNSQLGVEAGSLGWRKIYGSLRDDQQFGDTKLVYSLNASTSDSDNLYKHEYFEDQTLQGKVSVETPHFTVGLNVFDLDNEFGYAELDELSLEAGSRAEHWAFQTPDPEQYSETTEQVYSFYFEQPLGESFSHKLQLSQAKNTYSVIDPDNGLLGVRIAETDGIVPGSVAGDTLYIYDLRYPGISLTPLDLNDPANTAFDVRFFYEDQTDQYNYDVFFTGGNVDFVVGLEHLDQQAKQYGSYGEGDHDDSQTSYYGNGNINWLDDTLILSLGMRVDDYKSWGQQTTGTLGLSWQLTDRTSIYSNYGTSYTPANLSQLYDPSYGSENITPEDGRTYEIGIRRANLDRSLRLEATYWNTKINDVIFFDYSIENPRAFGGFGQYNNGAQARSSGVELQAYYDLYENVNVYANYTYTDSVNKSVGAEDWTRTVQIARHKGNVGFTYEQSQQLSLGANAYYSGPRLRWRGDVEMKDYVRVDLFSHYELTQSFTVSARIENLLDEDIEEGLGYKDPGRYTIFGLSYQF